MGWLDVLVDKFGLILFKMEIRPVLLRPAGQTETSTILFGWNCCHSLENRMLSWLVASTSNMVWRMDSMDFRRWWDSAEQAPYAVLKCLHSKCRFLQPRARVKLISPIPRSLYFFVWPSWFSPGNIRGAGRRASAEGKREARHLRKKARGKKSANSKYNSWVHCMWH